METAARKIARLDRSIARTGETVTLERIATDGVDDAAPGAVSIVRSLTVPAHVRANQPQDLDDGSVRDIKVIISPTQIMAETGSPPEFAFGLPIRDDRILTQNDQSNVQSVATFYYGGALVRVELLCRG